MFFTNKKSNHTRTQGIDMRITVHIADSLEKEIKKASKNENTSVSSLIAKATESYLKEKRGKRIGRRVLELIGKVKIAPDAIEELHAERHKDDRS